MSVQVVERLIDAKARGHITHAQYVAMLKAGNQPHTRVTVVVDDGKKKAKKGE